MNIVKHEHTTFHDVDETLIMHCKASEFSPGDTVVYIQDTIDLTKEIAFKVNENMVRLLKEESQRGSYVVVWSRGGWEWAFNVIRALKLENYVHQIMTKPMVYFDDKDISTWLPYRVYIEPNVTYKRNK